MDLRDLARGGSASSEVHRVRPDPLTCPGRRGGRGRVSPHDRLRSYASEWGMIAALQKRFRLRFVETARKRTRVALDGITRGGPEGGHEVVMQLHSLAGEAGTLGYSAVAQLALRGEE